MKGAKNRAEFLKKTLFTSSLARQRVRPGPGCGYCRLGDANIHPIVGRKRVVFAKEPEHALNLCRLDEASRRNFLQCFETKSSVSATVRPSFRCAGMAYRTPAVH